MLEIEASDIEIPQAKVRKENTYMKKYIKEVI